MQPSGSWRSLFGNAERHDVDLKLSYHELSLLDEEVVAVCPQPIISREVLWWSNTVVGNFLGR